MRACSRRFARSRLSAQSTLNRPGLWRLGGLDLRGNGCLA